MKKINAIASMLLLLASPTFAAGANVGAAQVNVYVTVKLVEGGKVVSNSTVTALVGNPVSRSIASEISCLGCGTPIKTGFFMTLTPAITKEGKIEVAFFAKKSEVTSIKNYLRDGIQVQMPQVSSIGVEHKIVLDEGNEVSIPFGSVNADGPELDQYVLKIAASTAPVQVVSKD